MHDTIFVILVVCWFAVLNAIGYLGAKFFPVLIVYIACAAMFGAMLAYGYELFTKEFKSNFQLILHTFCFTWAIAFWYIVTKLVDMYLSGADFSSVPHLSTTGTWLIFAYSCFTAFVIMIISRIYQAWQLHQEAKDAVRQIHQIMLEEGQYDC